MLKATIHERLQLMSLSFCHTTYVILIVLLLLVAVVFSLMTDFVFFFYCFRLTLLWYFVPSHASNPANIASVRHVSKNLNFTLISSYPTFCFDDIPFIFLNIVLASLSVSFTCSFRLGTYLLVQHYSCSK